VHKVDQHSVDGVEASTETSGLQPPDAARLERFEGFAAALRTVFHRADQSLRFRAYLRGLIEPGGRKNVESIAASAAALMMVESNLAQALQHFISQSPWDSHRLLEAVRHKTCERRRDPAAVWVVHDGAFAKKGVHSVGVHRQLDRAAGKKVNCQVGVFVSQLGPAGYFPLAAKLYLPGAWLKENEELAAKTIPEDDRLPRSKSEIAVALLDELKSEAAPLPVLAEAGYHSAANFTDVLLQRGFTVAPTDEAALNTARARFDWLRAELGLDHFEGRTWHGWHHHVSMVITAYHLLAGEPETPDRPPFSSLPR
jgi:SRSO17 transposase